MVCQLKVGMGALNLNEQSRGISNMPHSAPGETFDLCFEANLPNLLDGKQLSIPSWNQTRKSPVERNQISGGGDMPSDTD